jgi:hypothetical protein
VALASAAAPLKLRKIKCRHGRPETHDRSQLRPMGLEQRFCRKFTEALCRRHLSQGDWWNDK